MKSPSALRSPLSALLLAVAVASLGACLSAEPDPADSDASAAPSEAGLPAAQEPSPTPDPTLALRHCVVQPAAVPRGKPLPEKLESHEPTCFSTFPEALAFATKGKIQLTAADPSLVAAEFESVSESVLATYLIGIEYVSPHREPFWGSWLITRGWSCAEADPYVATMQPGWNDVISSSKTYEGCNHSYHYEHSNFGGAVLDCPRGTACFYDLGVLSDATSSIRWTL